MISHFTLTSILFNWMILVLVFCGITFIFWQTKKGMILEEAPGFSKQLCALKIKISYVRRKGGTCDFEKAPMLYEFITVVISTLCISYASLSGIKLPVTMVVPF
jgi:benzoyl-CoA reductase/2-hydroxyglutaryl-CoA dehydratase subunit BcrC/BadD/HgdB